MAADKAVAISADLLEGHQLRMNEPEEAERQPAAEPYEEQRAEWPPAADEPDRERSHPGARDDEEGNRGADA